MKLRNECSILLGLLAFVLISYSPAYALRRPIPSLSEWGLIVLGIAALVLLVISIRRRKETGPQNRRTGSAGFVSKKEEKTIKI